MFLISALGVLALSEKDNFHILCNTALKKGQAAQVQ